MHRFKIVPHCFLKWTEAKELANSVLSTTNESLARRSRQTVGQAEITALKFVLLERFYLCRFLEFQNDNFSASVKYFH